jgi:hypothetical protein
MIETVPLNQAAAAYAMMMAGNAKNYLELFELALEYELTDFQKAIRHASRSGTTGSSY